MDSVTLMREPFSVMSSQNFFSADQRTRITLFGYNLELKNGEGLSAITVQAEDSQHMIHALPVEAAREVSDFSWITGITVKLPDGLPIKGVVLCDQVKSLDWTARQARLAARLPAATMDDVLAKVLALLR